MANNRIAFGLCKKFNITLPKDATPKDAWAALDKISANELKKTLQISLNLSIEKEESPRKTKPGNFSVNWDVIHSSNYRKKLYRISKNERVVSAIETRARWALNNRDGSNTEELYAISLDNGREICKITNQHYKQRIERTEEFNEKIRKSDINNEKILLIHNHPKSLPPSLSDINTLSSNNNISGITVGHNGSIYYYTKPKMKIPELDYNVKVRHFKQYDEITCLEKTMEELSEEFGFEFYKL